jgi:UDP-N-acetylglucosamine 1-carboxyvinyltransferase
LDKFIITGGFPLNGVVEISGAKNAALPQLAASLLSAEKVVLNNVPDLMDVKSMIILLESLGAKIVQIGNSVEIDASNLTSHEAPYDLVRKMRASIVVLGPLLARTGEARVSMPGGCAIGARPVDLHIDAMQKLGARVEFDHGYVHANKNGGLKGGEIYFEKVTVTGTENALMAAVLAEGETVMYNCAMEPEVVDLGEMLQKMGAEIQGLGTSTITIKGVKELGGVEHSIISDRIEAGTYLIAGIISRGEVTVSNCQPRLMKSTLNKLEECNARLEVGEDYIKCFPSDLVAQDVRTTPYPGFPTDMQAQFVALMTQAQGSSVVTETIFENRFMHVPELNRMGANIRIDGNNAVVHGKVGLTAASVMATDLRASASLVLAGLVADGTTCINRVYHIDRGYNHIVGRLRALGANIQRIS